MFLSFLLSTPPSSYRPLNPIFYPALTTLIPVIVLSILTRFLQPTVPILFAPSANTTAQIEVLPQAVAQISALYPLTSGLIVSDHQTNSLLFLRNEDTFTHPLLENAGGTNETHSTTLRRAGISAFAEYSTSDHVTMLAVARHSAKDLALMPFVHNGHIPHPANPIVLANSYNGTTLNAPNGLYIDARGNIFFSDAYFGLIEAEDEFDRKLDDPPGKTHAQRVYYLPADEVRRAIEERKVIEPRLLVDKIDKPAGLAVYGDRLFISVASPRRPGIVEYLLQDIDNSLRALDPVEVFEWTGALHSWGQRRFSGVLGNPVIADGRLFVGAGDGVAVFDVTQRSEPKVPVAWIQAEVPPGAPALAFRDGWLFVGASKRIAKMRIR